MAASEGRRDRENNADSLYKRSAELSSSQRLNNHKKRHDTPTEGEMLKEAVLQLINYHHSFDRTLTETSGLLLSSGNVKEKNLSRIIGGLESRILGQTEGSSTETCAFRFMDIVHKCNKKSVSLSPPQKAEIELLMNLIKDLTKKGQFIRSRFLHLLCKENVLPLEILWMLHTAGVMTIDTYFSFKQSDSSFVDEMATLLCVNKSEEEVTDAYISVIDYISSLAFPEDSEMEKSVVKKVSSSILDTAVRSQLDEVCAGQSGRYLPVASLSNQSVSSVKKQYTHVVSLMLCYKPSESGFQILAMQSKWSYAKTPVALLTWCKQLLLVFEVEEIIQLLHQTLERQQINWRLFLCFVSMYLVCIPQASSHIHELICCWLKRGLEDSELEAVLVGFLLARQACYEGCHVFLSYNDWFQKTFGDGKSLAGNRKSFSFLLKVLTDMVPYETPLHLKTHVLRTPFVPPKCRELLGDYIMLAKTRLADFKEPIDLTGEDDTDKIKISEQVEKDVSQVVTSYQTSKKIPSFVMEASIFRKPYFVGRFLPALLKPRTLPDIPDVPTIPEGSGGILVDVSQTVSMLHLPDIPDARMKLIDALKRVEKIPSNMYTAYVNACKQEADKLLQGVFEEEDDDDDMIMEPMEQLNHRLGQLVDIVLNKNGQNTKTLPQIKLAEVLSCIQEKMSTVLNVELGHCDLYPSAVVIDVHSADLSLQHVQVVDAILNVMCKMSTVCIQSDQPDMTWAPQFMSVISEFPVLHKALVIRIWKLITENGPRLETHHINGLCMTTCLMAVLHGKFSPVVVQGCSTGDQMSNASVFSHHLWSALPCCSGQWMTFVLRLTSVYLQCVFSCLDDTQISQLKDFVLPKSLVKKYEFLCCRLLTEFGGHRDYTGAPDFRIAHIIYRSKKYKTYCQSIKLTFEDWIQMELTINPSEDCLSFSKRQEYLNWSVQQRYMKLSVEDGGCNYDYRQACSVLLKVLVNRELSTQNEAAVNCGKCCIMNTSFSENGSRALFVHLLQEMVNYFPFEKSSTDPDIPWLLKQMSACCNHGDKNYKSVATKCFMRIAVCLPGYLFFVDTVEVLDQDYSSSCEAINRHLRQHLSEGCQFLSDITLYLLQGLARCPGHADSSTVLSQCPMLTLSIMVHLQHTAQLVGHCIKNGKLKDQSFISVFLWLQRCIEEERGSSLPVSHPWLQSAALMALALHSEKLAKRVILDIKRQTDNEKSISPWQECLATFASLLLAELTLRDVFQQCKAKDMVRNILVLIITEFPWLLSQVVLADDKHQLIMSNNISRLRLLTLLRTLESCGVDLVTQLPKGLTSIISMFANVVELYEQGQASERHSNRDLALQDVFTMASFVKDCIRDSHPSQIRNVDQDMARKCGTDVLITLTEQLSGTY